MNKHQTPSRAARKAHKAAWRRRNTWMAIRQDAIRIEALNREVLRQKASLHKTPPLSAIKKEAQPTRPKPAGGFFGTIRRIAGAFKLRAIA